MAYLKNRCPSCQGNMMDCGLLDSKYYKRRKLRCIKCGYDNSKYMEALRQ